MKLLWVQEQNLEKKIFKDISAEKVQFVAAFEDIPENHHNFEIILKKIELVL